VVCSGCGFKPMVAFFLFTRKNKGIQLILSLSFFAYFQVGHIAFDIGRAADNGFIFANLNTTHFSKLSSQ
jgi:hypothetical protein